MTMVVTVAQAMACAQANVASISPPIAAIHQWNRRNNDSPFYDGESIQGHMGINFVKRMAQIFARHSYKTDIIPCDFATVEEVRMLTGIPKIALPVEVIQTLDVTSGVAVNTMDQVRGIALHRESDYYSDKAHFQEAAQAEPADIYNMIEEELLPDMRSLTNWITSVVDSYMTPYLTPVY
ncbi:hypothetical protein M408DRAFT_273548 [Serendipita vermifera MAFF 305830]|uniref:Uncharacterized protein n=1 Tax=Serendipita vermifera MAFF 305830 TaxID=933852 RepID=A0A0C3BFM7_SERVB|nr:hypothetical protein M408DRAFT_273548 [Serendipita vermifera MAFF 305830]